MPIHSSSAGQNRLVAVVAAVVLTAIAAARAGAQELTEEPDRPGPIVLQLGGGASLSFGPEQTVPADAEESRTGLTVLGRVLWRPEHLLGIGLESGFTRVSSMRTSASDGLLHLSVVPVMAVFAMETHGVAFAISTGWQRYIISTQEHEVSSAWEMSYRAGLSYSPLSLGPLRFGLELGYAALPEREIGMASATVLVGW